MNGPKLENMKAFRLSLGMTQEEFARSLGLSKSTYNNYETGARDPGAPFLIQVSKMYNITVDYLVGRSSNPHRYFSEAEEFTAQNDSECQLLRNYRSLNDEGQEKLLDYSDDLVALGKYKKHGEFEMGSKEAQ